MRLPAVNCILLACIATSMATEDSPRSKRDLQYLKDIVLSKLFGSPDNITVVGEPVLVRQDGEVKIYRIPGFDDILIKAVPKAVQVVQEVPEKTVVVDPTIAILESYLGTQSQGETLVALQGVKNLLQSGILLKPKPVVTVHGPPKVPLIPVLPPPMLSPVPIMQDMIPVEPLMSVPLPNKYSYKQVQDGSLTTFSSIYGGDVTVTRSNQPIPPPPPYIMERLHKICLGKPAVGMQAVPLRPVPAPFPLRPALPPLQPVPFPKPVMYDVPMAPVLVPSIHTVVEAPRHEIKVPRPCTHHNQPSVLVQDPVLVPSPPKTQGGYAFNIINGESHLMPHHALPNPYLLEPYISRRVCKPMIHHMPNNFPMVVEDRPRFEGANAGGYSYKQVNHDGTLITYSGGDERNGNPVVISEAVRPMPMPPVHIVNRLETVAAKAHAVMPPRVPSGYAYKLVNNGGFHRPGQHSQSTQTASIPIATEAHIANGYSYKNVHNGIVTTHSANSEVRDHNSKDAMPAPPSHIVKRIEKVAAKAHATQQPTSGYSYKLVDSGKKADFMKGETHAGEGLQTAPIAATYVYKQINHNNPIPFTVVKVEDPRFGKAEVGVERRTGGTQYHNVHVNQPTQDIPNGYVFVPPAASEGTSYPSEPKVENGRIKTPPPQFSYKQVSNHGVYYNQDGSADLKGATSRTEAPKVETSHSASSHPGSLANNPIVVPEDQSYSYKQTKPDGSSIDVIGSGDKVVSVDVNGGARQEPSLQSLRGDIPDAYA